MTKVKKLTKEKIIIVLILIIIIFSVISYNKITVKRKLDICSKEEFGRKQTDCYLNLAKELEDESICNVMENISIFNGWVMTFPIADCYTEFAVIKKDVSMCKRLENSKERIIKNCINDYNKDFGNFENTCNDWLTKSIAECYTKVAVIKEDISMCRSESCYIQIAKDLKDISICNTIKSETCLKELALVLNDVNLCKNLSEGYLKSECYHELALKLNNLSLCKYIPADYERKSFCEKGQDYKIWGTT